MKWLDAFLWKNFRWYRRREMRKRLVRPVDKCEWCGGTERVLRLSNDERICLDCRAALAQYMRSHGL